MTTPVTPHLADAAGRTDLEDWGAIPYDPAVPRAVRLQEPVVTAFPKSPAAAAYRALAERLWPAPGPESRERDHVERLGA